MQIVEVLIEYANRSLNRPFSYLYKGKEKLEKGIRVLVGFNHREIVGYVINVIETNKSEKEIEEESGYQVSEVIDVIDKAPILNEELLSLLDEVSDYYLAPKISVLQVMLPSEYLYTKGYSRSIIPDTCPFCYRVCDFCDDHLSGRYLLAIGTHVVTVIDGDYYDTWDSGQEIPIYYFKRRNK